MSNRSSPPEEGATGPAVKRLALVFDFDKTLAPDSFPALLEYCDLDADTFQKENVQPLKEDGWDTMLARFFALMQTVEARDDLEITADTFSEVGRQLDLYPEAEGMFERVRGFAAAILPDIEVEFYLLTAGMLAIPRATSIAGEFRTLWGGELYFNEDGALKFVKHIVSNPDKIRYLLKLSKGFNLDKNTIDEDVYQDVPAEDLYLPLSQLIYVGDGDSDMPVFAYLSDHEGLAIGVFKADSVEEWEGYDKIKDGLQVQNLAKADYREDSELMRSLKLAVESICKQIALRQKSVGE